MLVHTYLKFQKDFIRIENLDREVKGFYIAGAIHIQVGEQILLGKTEWDYVDQLWAYLIDGLFAVAEGNCFKTDLPDQPISVCFDPISEGVRLRVHAYGHFPMREALVPTRVFLSTMIFAASQFIVIFSDHDRSKSRKNAFSKLLTKLNNLKEKHS